MAITQNEAKNLVAQFIKDFTNKSDIDNKRIFLRGYVGPAYEYLDDKTNKPIYS